MARRLEAARGELEYGRAEGNFDLRLVNDQVGVFTVHVRSPFAWKIAFGTILKNNVKVMR